MAAVGPIGGEQVVLPYEPQYPPPTQLDAVPHPQPGPPLPVPFALKGRGHQVRPDLFQELGVREGGLGSAFAGGERSHWLPLGLARHIVR
jgi:hypothetical protein